MKVRYLGPHDSGVVPWLGRDYEVVRGEEVEVPDDLGASLVTQDSYVAVDGRGRDVADAPEGTVDDVKAWVKGDPARAAQALAAEQEREKPRPGLVTALEEIIAAGAADQGDEA